MSIEMLETIAMERLPLKSVKLICGEQVLLDGSASLQEAGLSNETIVSVVHKSLRAFTAVYEHSGEPIDWSKNVRVEERTKATLQVSDDGSAKISVYEYVCDESDTYFDPWAGMGYEGITEQVFVGNVVDYDGHQFTAMFTHLEETSSSYPHHDKEVCSKDIRKQMIAKIDDSTLTIVSADLNGRRHHHHDSAFTIGDTWTVKTK
mmetsp:Transcript_51540/g.89996  ORF Transcript_51540/g.89996 Transcript_51540/m.89996 type:complete len:205 (+) Transcript_51540:430-1044(+)